MATTKITNPELFDLGSLNTALKLPSGTTAQRPTSPSTGEWRYNTTTNLVEFWDGGAWTDLQSEDIPPTPSENFNVVLYDGNGSTNNITGVGFQPDWVWIKQRDTAVENHNLYDSTRGIRNYIVSNSSAGNVFGSAQRLNAFGADGFTVGSDNEINDSGSKYVAWCWKANGGTTSSNTDGTNITSTVQVNAKAGFSIVQFTTPGTFSGSNTVGHGLGSTPDAIFVKRTDGAEDWYVYHQAAGLNKASRLNSTINYSNATYLFGTVNSTVFNPNYTSATSLTNIAYCFKSIPGYSKFGSYTGNGTTLVVNTGFQPGWIMIKSTVGNDNWRMYDTTRGISAGGFLKADTTATESTADAPNFLILSNGFEITAGGTAVGNNVNGNLYTYYAFAADATAAPTLPDSFANKLYTGTGSPQSITGLGFSPSLVWLKSRNQVNKNVWTDIVRGANKQLFSDSTDAQSTSTDRITSFDADGFTLNSGGTFNRTNNNGTTYASWNWKASSVPAINTDGTIQSIVSANQASGFSIVTWTGDGNASATVGHGLSGTPDFIMLKDLTQIGGWNGGQVGLASNEGIGLQSSAAAFTGMGGNGGITYGNFSATNFGFATGSSGVDSVNKNGNQYVAYCWKSVAGFSSIGSYTGQTAGVTITTGFRPSFIMVKSSSNIENWAILDTARGSGKSLNPNTDDAESDSSLNTFTVSDTGFSFPDQSIADAMLNENGYEYIYMAYKENPAQYAIPSGQMGYLVAAGGGSGFYSTGAGGVGGGGAGGFRTTYGLTSGGGASAETNLTLATGTYTVTIGAGGAMASGAGNDGNDSSITGLVTITTTGGGAGGGGNAVGAAGGSGGGGGELNSGTSLAGGAGTANQGFAGGTSVVNFNGAGGGGASSVGANNGANLAGNGGLGITSAITGSSVGYAGGGGGAAYQTSSTGGLGSFGGGSGTLNGIRTTAEAGDVNTGGGGGALGGSIGANGYTTGGSGIVVFRMNTTDYSGTTSGSPTVTTIGSETILQYLASGSYTHNPSTASGQMNYLVLAGGASGGSNGGGGGSGGLRSSWYSTGGGAASETPLTLSSGTYTITIGGGGAETTVYQNAGNNGTATTISGNATVNTVGGGGGGSNNNSPLTGGSGGGSGSGGGGSTGAAGTADEGFAGGNGMASTHPYTGGGGGGSGFVGGGASTSGPGAGGDGAIVSITGTAVNYGGGGGGTGGTGVGYTGPGGAGGAGGGGAGGAYNTTGIAATVNTGGGGGASGDNVGVGGAGGSGKVILRLITSEYSGTTTGSPTVTTVGTETVLTFTGSGTYVHS